jgi:hypothetical protein
MIDNLLLISFELMIQDPITILGATTHFGEKIIKCLIGKRYAKAFGY